MAAHYSVGVLPARPGKPRDKAKVEAGVRFAQTYILGRLHGLTFFSLAECNEAIALVMRRMNDRPVRNLGLSRQGCLRRSSATLSSPCPPDDWEFAEWRRARSISTITSRSTSFCIQSRTRSSAPRSTCGSPREQSRSSIGANASASISAVTLGLARHGPRPYAQLHRRYAEWTPDRFRRWAGKIETNTEELDQRRARQPAAAEQGFRTCLGILRSYRGLDPVRVEAVSARAVELGVLNCRGVASLLARKRDAAASRPATLFDHANLRGPGYYH